MPQRSSRLTAKSLSFWPVIAIVAVGDFITKRIAESLLTLHLPHEVAGPWVRFTLTYNPGAALSVSLGDFSRVGLSGVAVAMLLVLYRMYRQAAHHDAWQALALGLVAGGALGNLADRVRSHRGVVDFIDIGTAEWRFYIFNVADVGVVCGAILLAILLARRPDPTPAPAPAPAPGSTPAPGTTAVPPDASQSPR